MYEVPLSSSPAVANKHSAVSVGKLKLTLEIRGSLKVDVLIVIQFFEDAY